MASQNIIPMLSYKNGVAAIDWLCNAFEFVENKKMRFIEEDIVAHAELHLNDSIIMLATPTKNYKSINEQRKEYAAMNNWMNVPYIFNGLLVYVDDVDEHYKTAKENGAEILSEIENDFPGKRYRCADLEGHRWMFMEKK